MSDLQERFARAIGWTAVDGSYKAYIQPLDHSILPVIWGECEKRGWEWEMGMGGATIWRLHEFKRIGKGENPDPVLALVEAFVKAVEVSK